MSGTVEVDIDAWIQGAAEFIEAAAHESIAEVAKEAAQLVRDYTYPNRRLTRQSVRYKIIGRRKAVVGLYFGRRYSTRKDTFTVRHFEDVWNNDVLPRIEPRLITRLNQQLQK